MPRPASLRRSLLVAGLAASAATLSACGGNKAPDPAQSDAAGAAPDAKPGISAADGRLVLPVVPGRPGVAYFTVRNAGDKEAVIAAAHVTGAEKSEMHRTSGGSMAPVEQLPIAPGTQAIFAPGGLHVMVFGIGPSLKPGDTSELTLTFADGDKISIPLAVEAFGSPGGGAHHMSS